MNVSELSNLLELDQAIAASSHSPILLFKHSTRCSISATVLDRLKRKWPPEQAIKFYYLDLIRYRLVSDEIAKRFKVEHESPQALLLYKGQCIWHASHYDISVDKISHVIY